MKRCTHRSTSISLTTPVLLWAPIHRWRAFGSGAQGHRNLHSVPKLLAVGLVDECLKKTNRRLAPIGRDMSLSIYLYRPQLWCNRETVDWKHVSRKEIHL